MKYLVTDRTVWEVEILEHDSHGNVLVLFPNDAEPPEWVPATWLFESRSDAENKIAMMLLRW